MTNILYITPYYPPDYAGGARLAHSVAKKLSDEFEVIVLTKHQNTGINATKRENFEGIQVIRVRNLNDFIGGKFLTVLLLLWEMIIFARSYAIIHFIGIPNEVFPMTILGFLFGKKMISTMELTGDDDLESIKKSFLGWLKVLVLGLHKNIGALSQELIDKSKSVKFLKDRIVELPNAIEFDKYIPLLLEKKLELRKLRTPFANKDKVLLFCGAIGKRKGCDLILGFMKENHEFILKENLKFLLVGPIEDEKLGKEFGTFDFVHMTGVVTPNLVIEYYQISDIFIFPSRREGFGRVVLEARSCGLVSIVSDILPMQQITRDKINGVLFESGNIADFSVKIKEVLTNKLLFEQIQSIARSSIEEKYKISDLVKRHEKLYKEIVK